MFQHQSPTSVTFPPLLYPFSIPLPQPNPSAGTKLLTISIIYKYIIYVACYNKWLMELSKKFLLKENLSKFGVIKVIV